MSARRRAVRTAVLVSLGASGCIDALLAPTPADDPVTVARAAWAEVDAYHPFFERSGLDWDAVGTAYLPLVTPGSTDDELFTVLSDMVRELRDGHAALIAPGRGYTWTGWKDGHPENFDATLLAYYLRPPSGSAAGGTVRWGMLEGGLGYLRIGTFGRTGIGSAVDAALASLGAVPGLVVDIRSNGGGSDTQTKAAVGRLIAGRVHFRTIRYKNGPGHDDFGPEIRDFVEPDGAQTYHGPLVLLQNRLVYSAAEDFVLAMRVRPDVTIVGDTTGGGAGNPIPRELPNGWVLRVSRWQAWAADGTWYEGVGLPPDVVREITPADLAAGRDPLLETAIALLSG